MKDKTHAMNREITNSEAEAGFGNAGKPSTRNKYKSNQLECADLLENQGLMNYENTLPENSKEELEEMGGGFLPRNNYEDRF